MSHSPRRDIVRVHPNEFIHVLDLNTNVARLIRGPQSVLLQTNEKLLCDPCPCLVIPPGYYCIIADPARDYSPETYHDEQLHTDLGQTKILFHNPKVPYPLYPGEIVEGAPKFAKDGTDYRPGLKPLPVIKADHAIKLQALQDVTQDGVERKAGDLWQIKGPVTYHPCPGVEMKGLVKPIIINHGQVLKLKATQATVDHEGKQRATGEEWLIKRLGAYLPDVFEEVVSVDGTTVLTPELALHLRATQSITDSMGKKRVVGEEWLFTNKHCSEYSTQVGVEIIKKVEKTVLKKGQFAVIDDPVDAKGKQQLGEKVLKIGLCSFFLHPGETLQKVQQAYLLSGDESIVLKANKGFVDSSEGGEPVTRRPGDRWLIKGPLNYIPPIEVSVVEQRSKIPLSKNEGIYVQDLTTGQVRLVMGPCAYMMTANEVLWKKDLGKETEVLLSQGGGAGKGNIRKVAYFEQSIDPSLKEGRDKTKVVTYRCPSNTAVQVNNYQDKKARVIFGPDLVVLGPHENFNVLSLSAGKPKKPNELKSLCLMLGPDFISDIIEVETADHARLRMRISFNNYFEIDKSDPLMAAKLFSVPDFIGFACKRLGSQIRATVALTLFDEFHRHSAKIIQSAVFGRESLSSGETFLKFDVNNLVISGIDIESVEPVDTKMRDSLSKSVQLAIEIATSSIEAAAKHEAERAEQKARGQLERQILLTEKESERERCKLNELRAIASAVESTGQAKAEAQAQAERMLIECQSEIDIASLKSEAARIEHEATLSTQNKLRFSELEYLKKKNNIEIAKVKGMAQIEVDKMSKMVSTIGPKTLVAMSNAGPANQVKLLSGLGLESVLLTDGKSPINLLTTAQGLVAQPQK